MLMLNVGLYLARLQDTVFMGIFAVSCTATKRTRSAQQIPCPLPRAQSVVSSRGVMALRHKAGAIR